MQTNSGFLTPDERSALLKVLHKSRHSARDGTRANAILLIDKGWSVPETAGALFLDVDTVYGYLSRYTSGKLSALLHDDYQGKQSKLTDEQKNRLSLHVAKHLYMDSKRIAEYIQVEFGVSYSLSGTHALLHELGFVYKKPDRTPGKYDPEAQERFIQNFNKLMAVKSQETYVYFTDAVHPSHNSTPAYGWIMRGERKELAANTGRQRLNIHGALNAETNSILTLESASINAEATVELLKKIDAAHPSAERIYVIADNAGYYHADAVKTYLASGRSHIHLWFLPVYSPNLNLIERVWKFLRNKVINNRYYPTFKKFSEEILMFFDCLSEYADELKTLLTHNFQRYKTPKDKLVKNAH